MLGIDCGVDCQILIRLVGPRFLELRRILIVRGILREGWRDHPVTKTSDAATEYWMIVDALLKMFSKKSFEKVVAEWNHPVRKPSDATTEYRTMVNAPLKMFRGIREILRPILKFRTDLRKLMCTGSSCTTSRRHMEILDNHPTPLKMFREILREGCGGIILCQKPVRRCRETLDDYYNYRFFQEIGECFASRLRFE